MMVILDIGSNDGSNGLAFAMLNPNINVYSFEPNPYLKKVILGNKRKIEKRFRIYLKNFFFIGEAVSNKDEKRYFILLKMTQHHHCSNQEKNYINIGLATKTFQLRKLLTG